MAEDEQANIFVLSAKGFGKRSVVDDYRITNRGGKGVLNFRITEKTGSVIAIDKLTDDDDLMLITRSGITIRLAASEIRVTGRATQGVKLINLTKRNDTLASGTVVPHDDDEEHEQVDGELTEEQSIPEDSTETKE